MSHRATKAWANPEVRARRLAGMRASQARRKAALAAADAGFPRIRGIPVTHNSIPNIGAPPTTFAGPMSHNAAGQLGIALTVTGSEPEPVSSLWIAEAPALHACDYLTMPAFKSYPFGSPM